MNKTKNAHLGKSLSEFVRTQKAKDPVFAMEFDKLRVARRIRQLREERHLTQEELASRVRTTQSAIARLESGKVTPKLDLLQRIAFSLGLRLSIEFN